MAAKKRRIKKVTRRASNGVAEQKSGQPLLESDVPVPARSLAQLCGVDLKTVHQWAVAGLIPHFRTPGRHLRFRPEDVAEFLKRTGHPSARGALLRPAVLVVGTKRNTKRAGSLLKNFEVHHADDAYSALAEVSRLKLSALLVDSEALPSSGADSYLKALGQAAPAVPVVVFGGRPAGRLHGASVAATLEDAARIAGA